MTKARDLANLISGGISASEIPDLPASKITSGTIASARISLSASDIPNLDTAKITSGTLADGRVAASNVTQHSGGFSTITASGEIDAGSLDVSGDADIDGILEADAITIGGIAIASVLSPVAGSGSIVTTGALNSGSITSGFGNIDIGSSAITATGAISGGALSGTSLDLNGGELILDSDNDTSITSDTDDRVDIKVAGSDRVHVTSTGLGVGTSTVSVPLSVQSDSNASAIRVLGRSADDYSELDFYEADNSTRLVRLQAHTSGFQIRTDTSAPLIFKTNTTERMRIDSSGNFVVGKTSANASGTVGFEYNNGGQLAVTRSDNTVALLNRNTSNGAILDFRRDNSLIGTIAGTIGLIIGTGDTGLGFQTSTGDAIIPQRPDTQAAVNNQLSLGNSSYAFRDLHLANRLKLGASAGIEFGHAVSSATGASASSTLLDHYEEGTWTPSFVAATNQGTFYNRVGRYTRIGRLVVVQFFYQVGGTRPTFSNNASQFLISGIPFSVASSGYTGSQGSVNAQSFNYNSTYNNQGMGADYLSASINGSEQLHFTTTNSGQTRGIVNNLSANSSHWIVEATVSYFTDA